MQPSRSAGRHWSPEAPWECLGQMIRFNSQLTHLFLSTFNGPLASSFLLANKVVIAIIYATVYAYEDCLGGMHNYMCN